MPLSRLAEFAGTLHETASPSFARTLAPASCPSRAEKLYDIRAVIFDVYGTLINYWRPGLDNKEDRPRFFLSACREVADRFGFTEYLVAMNPGEEPEKTLYDLYCGLIALGHEKALKKGVAFPEVKVEEIWQMILLMLRRRGYDPAGHIDDRPEELSRYLAYTYNFYSLGRTLYPGVVQALTKLKQNQFVLGIVSNAQFYTPIDLTLLIREQGGGTGDEWTDLFDQDLCFFSYEYGVAKPNTILFRRLFDALYEYHILPQQTVFVGNDLALDIEPAQAAGLKTALFAGDALFTYFHDKRGIIVPDCVFTSWNELPEKLSFFSTGTGVT